ncbi:MAG TPA: hypothetical protein VE988_29625 [Gemmataceae bacterium]|nr:hypothetical protein [Gemmataceae bacterium]
MSQLVLDDQLDVQVILPALEPWITAVRLQSLRPGEHVLDDRVPEILRTMKTPTFVTIDHGFWNRRLCHAGYCILFFDLLTEEQEKLPKQLRRLFRLSEFRTRAVRMGKVARIDGEEGTFWEGGKKEILVFSEGARRERE